ncbi:hypothetical protein EDC04DRAFT_2585138, partial [Pisolithus marmoratus]
WDDLVKDYFILNVVMDITPWKDNQRLDRFARARLAFATSYSRVSLNGNWPFHVTPVLLVTTQSGVKSMSLSLDDTRE